MPAKRQPVTARSARDIELGDDGTFKLHVRNPTFKELETDNALESLTWDNHGVAVQAEARQQQITHRLRSTILGWSEMNDADDKPIPFTWEEFAATCEQYPLTFWDVLQVSGSLFNGVKETERKNSVAPSSSSSEEMMPATMPTTNSQ